MDIVSFIIASLATYRLTQLLVYDRGPFAIFEQFRGWTKKIALDHRIFNGLAFGITCPFCTGVWMAALCGVMIVYPSQSGDLFLIVFGLAGLQTVIERKTL